MCIVIPNDVSEEPIIAEMAKLDLKFFDRRVVLGLSNAVVLQKPHAFLLTYHSDYPRETMLGNEFLEAIENKYDRDDLEALQIYDEATSRIVALPSLFRRTNVVLYDVYGGC